MFLAIDTKEHKSNNEHIESKGETKMNKQVIISQSDLEKLEDCRLKLYDFLESKGLTKDTADVVKITNITQHIWNLANKKHPVYVEPLHYT